MSIYIFDLIRFIFITLVPTILYLITPWISILYIHILNNIVQIIISENDNQLKICVVVIRKKNN